jgi:uncharacterized protein YdeI (YjbR/CyaY-like superfamily)
MEEDQLDTFYPKTREEWRNWLKEYHNQKASVWLIFDKKTANINRITWTDAVEEALCFGWIDSRSKPINRDQYMQFYSRRKATSTWSRINKDKVKLLQDTGLMAPAGLKSIETAKKNGTWGLLDGVEALLIPEDLEQALNENQILYSRFEALSKSMKKQILLSLVLAKRAETRKKRIDEISKRLLL